MLTFLHMREKKADSWSQFGFSRLRIKDPSFPQLQRESGFVSYHTFLAGQSFYAPLKLYTSP